MTATAEYKKIGGGGEVIPPEEIKRRLDQGDQFNAVFSQAYDAAINSGSEEPKARKYANNVLLDYGRDFFEQNEGLIFDLQDNASREKLYSLVYDRRRIAIKLGKNSESKFDQNIITHIPWAALQTLATNLISSETLKEFIALFSHYLTRENCTHFDAEMCPNSLRPDNKTVRLYCYKPTQQNINYVHSLYLSLREELNTLNDKEFMELQTAREQAIQDKFSPQAEEEEEAIAQEPTLQELPVVLPVKPEPMIQELPVALPVKPEISVVQHTTEFTGQALGFSNILNIKNALITELEKQVVAQAERIAVLEEEQATAAQKQTDAEESLWLLLEETQEKLKLTESQRDTVQAEFEKFKLETNTFNLTKSNAQRSLQRATAQLNDALRSVKEALTAVVND